MFKILLPLFSLAVLLVGILIYPIRPKDHLAYAELLKSSNPEGQPLFSHPSNQQSRLGVCKQIWYQDTTPLYFRIESKESDLFFTRSRRQPEVMEKLREVTCIMQEELYYKNSKPMQRVRYLEAESACYHYTTNLFVGEGVKIWKYEVEGHTPPTQTLDRSHPLMQATAESVEFILKGRELDFTAHHMRAHINTHEAL